MKYIDFHTHTTYSDGRLDARTLLGFARLKGLDAIAITDHDNYRGYLDGVAEAVKWGIELVPGVEVTTPVYHILGLGVDLMDKRFQTFLDSSRELQERNCLECVRVLNRNGFEIDWENFKEFFGEGVRLGKGNLVQYLVAHSRIFRGPSEISSKISHFKSRAYAISSSDAIKEIHRAKGITILAHPFKEVKDFSEIDKLVEEGLDGLEIQPTYGERNIKFREFAERNGLRITYGSDYHGPDMEKRPLLGRGENVVHEDLLKCA